MKLPKNPTLAVALARAMRVARQHGLTVPVPRKKHDKDRRTKTPKQGKADEPEL